MVKITSALDAKVTTKAEYEYIRVHSSRCVIVCGPSGTGKTMSIEYMIRSRGYKSMPFITTRALRSGEADAGSRSVNYEEFMNMRLENKVFLLAHNYGNSYGYDVDCVYEALLGGDIVVFECPAAQLLTDIQVLLPNALVLGYVSYDHSMTMNILEARGDQIDMKTRLRILQAAIESSNVQIASEKMSVCQIFPIYGEPQRTIDQVEVSISHQELLNDSFSKSIRTKGLSDCG